MPNQVGYVKLNSLYSPQLSIHFINNNRGLLYPGSTSWCTYTQTQGLDISHFKSSIIMYGIKWQSTIAIEIDTASGWLRPLNVFSFYMIFKIIISHTWVHEHDATWMCNLSIAEPFEICRQWPPPYEKIANQINKLHVKFGQ